MPSSSCFCPGCKSGYVSDTKRRKINGESLPSLFKAPRDSVLFERWKRAIPRADRQLESKDVVCSLHFKAEDINTHFEHRLFDGTLWREKRKNPSLKKDAVPCIFPNLPQYLSSTNKKRKLPPSRGNAKKKCKSVSDSLQNKEPFGEGGKGESNDTTNKKKRKKKNNEGENASKSEKIVLPSILTEQVVDQDTDFQVPEKKLTAVPTIQKNLTEVPIIDENLTLNTNLASELLNKEKPAKEKSNEFLQMIFDILTKESELIQASPVTEEEVLESSNEHSTLESELLETRGEEFSFNFVKMNLHVIKKANSWWAINAFENFIICARWNSECVLEKKIFIYQDLSYKVFLKEKEIKMWNKLELKSFKNISKVIEQVENIHVCNGLNNQNPNCYGFVQYGKVVCRQKNLCINCVRAQARLKREEKERLREEKRNHVELLRIHFKY